MITDAVFAVIYDARNDTWRVVEHRVVRRTPCQVFLAAGRRLERHELDRRGRTASRGVVYYSTEAAALQFCDRWERTRPVAAPVGGGA